MHPTRLHVACLGALLSFSLASPPLDAATVTLRPSKDTTIYGNGDANLSNGGGQFLLAGSSGERRRLRSLIAFDLAGQIPAGSTINAVTLTFAVNTPLASNRNSVALHRLTADWGEGTLVAPMGEGGGAPANPGDATWNSRAHGSATWTSPGGDFLPTASAQQAVGAPGTTVTLAADGLAADVRAWLANPASNFGWILIATDEAGPAVRFASRQGSPAPSLVIDYTAGTSGGTTPPPPPPPPAGGPITSRLSNLSVRAAMAADQTLFVGFSVSGGSRQILIRGVGPTLASFGLAGTMSDPRLELFNGSALEAQNNDWNNAAALSNASTGVGAFPLLAGSRDAALLQSVDGSRSAQLRGSGPGIALVELYDTGTGNSPRLVNVSARNQVGTGDNILIVGFFVEGTGTKNLLIRAVGPQLTALGVSGALVDPRLDLFRSGNSTAIAANDNWDASLATTFNTVGAFALGTGSRDAALVTALTPGSYTVQVSGVGNTTGEALVEIYELP